MELKLFLLILLLLPLFQLSFASSTKFPWCNEHDQIALLHLKQSFSLDQTNCPIPNPHLLSWVVHNLTNNTAGCCSWEGVTCEAISGRVIGLDLSYGCLRGAIASANPIFRISQLQQINLSGNDFDQSQIPSAFGKFSMLKSLNLSQASFSGSVPQGILELSSLTSLDLSGNPSLYLPLHGLESIAQHMKDLNELSLSLVDISSVVPATFANLTSLRMLHLEESYLQDNFPVEILLLPRLESLNLMYNYDLYGQLPKFPIGRSSLRSLQLASTKFKGELPRSIGNLISLQVLHVDGCIFSGQLPPTIGNLTSLRSLDLGFNSFSPTRFSWIGKLTELKELYLVNTNLYGFIPSSLSNLKQIEILYLSFNYLSGQIPSSVGNLTQLEDLRLDANILEGQIPSSIFSLKNLEVLSFLENNLNGTVDISMSHEHKNIRFLSLAANHLSVFSNKYVNFSLPNLEVLNLDGCNLREFPLFLKKQDKLTLLSLSSNNIIGETPEWFFNVSTKTMAVLNIDENFLTRFEQTGAVSPLSKLRFFSLHHNNIHGSIPLPPPSIFAYLLHNNFLTDLSPTICKANNISILDLSNNELGGAIPECLGNMVGSLQILNLQGNKFEEKIPQIQIGKCSLRWMDLSQNRLTGNLPRSLAKCRDLVSLNLGNNQITDTFPSWLGTLPNLQVLILKINNFYGPMGRPSSKVDFTNLRIIDLSNNALNGSFPSKYFPFWKHMMRILPEKQPTYLEFTSYWNSGVASLAWRLNYPVSIDIMNKGMDRKYDHLSNLMVYISLSSNNFVGEIPESIGDLIGLVGLDLSKNSFNGSIPSSLGELKQLESLDLSLNMLFGEIPQQLSQLTFLEFLNVSYNNLSGAIPEGTQMSTFANNSFVGNAGLYGLPLSNVRGSANEPTTAPEGQDPGSSEHTKLVLGFEGFATGLAIGLGIGYIVTTRYHQWFVKTCLKLRHRKQ